MYLLMLQGKKEEEKKILKILSVFKNTQIKK
jgi:hypothetical protein